MTWIPGVGRPHTTDCMGWLIERGQRENHTPTVWWVVGPSLASREGEGWTEDASKATRFTTKAEAEAVIDALFAGLSDASAHATEHMWFQMPNV